MRKCVLLLCCLMLQSCQVNASENTPWVASAFAVQSLTGSGGMELAGWYNDGWDDESHAVYTAKSHLFSEVNPYWYNLG